MGLEQIIAEEIKARREALGLTKYQLSKMVGATNMAQVGRWEDGRYAPGAHYLLKLADALGCTVDALLGR